MLPAPLPEAPKHLHGTLETGRNVWTAMSANGNQTQIGHEDVKTSGGTEYVVAYGVATDDDQPTGIYTDTIIYTATTK